MTSPEEKSSSLERVLEPLRADEPGLAAQVRRGLLGFGYTGEGVQGLLNEVRVGNDYVATAARVAPVTPMGCLLRAFVLGAATAEETLREQLGGEFYGLCERAGLWERVEGGVVGSVVIMVDGKTFLLSDRGDVRLGERGMYWVMGIGTSTAKLGNSLPRRRYERVLDLCCGAGVQGFLLAPYAGRVVGVDQNRRALNYGRFGAGMNKFTAVEFRESDCYSAVSGELFDAIVCNPPYVLTPERESYYRDGGMGGDRFAERVLREAPGYLHDGGVAHIMCDVAAMEGKTAEVRLQSWLKGSGCDVLAIGTGEVEAGKYARNWLAKEWTAEAEERWRACFRSLEVTGVTNLLVVLRKREGANWFRREVLSGEPRGLFGHQVERLFACEDLAEAGDGALGRARLRVAAEVRLTSRQRAEGGKWVGESARLGYAEGMPVEIEADTATAAGVAAFDGKRAAADVIAASKWKISTVRRLVRSGILEPVER
jgi:SAM-dependent methyltransferase